MDAVDGRFTKSPSHAVCSKIFHHFHLQLKHFIAFSFTKPSVFNASHKKIFIISATAKCRSRPIARRLKIYFRKYIRENIFAKNIFLGNIFDFIAFVYKKLHFQQIL
jgi:hypothetical protein